MKVAVTGGTGLVGHFIVRGLAAAGHEVTVLSRRSDAPLPAGVALRPFDLEAPDAAAVSGMEALVHGALDHVPGRYRGGEGGDAAGFLSRNLGGTLGLFQAARDAGVGRVLFLSSRAVYGDYPAGTLLSEDLQPRPDTLYGHVKREAEAALERIAGPDLAGVSLRVTGVYGPAPPGRAHKWAALFESFAQGEAVPPRIGTEVHGEDVASAVNLLLAGPPRSGLFNVSDIVLDRSELLREFSRLTGTCGRLPEACDRGGVSAMTTDRLRAEGWRPRGWAGFGAALEQICRGAGSGA